MQRVVDKTIRPFTLTSMRPQDLTTAKPGVVPIGVYKGAAAFWDLDKAVNQPLVSAEQLHIAGNIDGAGATGLVAMTIALGAVAGTVASGTITVPTGQVWFITAVLGTCAADATGTIVYNWRCSAFPDAGGNVLGALYHTVWLPTPVAPPATGQVEFWPNAPVFGIGNKPVPLRLAERQTITGQLMNAVGAANATGVVGAFQIFGYVGKILVA